MIASYERAINGDEGAQTTIWRMLRPRMLRVIRLKAADLHLEWLADADGIYDLFVAELFTRDEPIRFANKTHLTWYIEKSLRRRTLRFLASPASACFKSLAIVETSNVAENDAIEGLARRDELESALSKLTTRERSIFELFGEGLPWREIGIRLGLTADNARMAFRRAIRRLRNEHFADEVRPTIRTQYRRRTPCRLTLPAVSTAHVRCEGNRPSATMIAPPEKACSNGHIRASAIGPVASARH
jgi:RNA polymerase sigma factor (sigma-70 family)